MPAFHLAFGILNAAICFALVNKAYRDSVPLARFFGLCAVAFLCALISAAAFFRSFV